MVSISLQFGDITTFRVDAIVNSANSSLLGGGGVDGAIHRVGGPEILAECKSIIAKTGSCPAGEAVITGAGNLPAQYVIHTVGPVWRGGKHDEQNILSKAYYNSLKLGSEYNCKSIAFPNISTGIYGFPKEKAAEIAISTCREFLVESKRLKSVIFVCFDEENNQIYKGLFG